MNEFTGERVIPGQVNEDLWAEHVARYAFAKRFTLGKKSVLDLGCGTGYGTAELAAQAQLTVGVDLAPEAVAYASEHFPGALFLQCSATALPFAPGSFDVATAFEVIEHLADWNSMLAEARRVLRPDGVLIVSTPNKLYYAETRGTAGPNPYHQHEFEFGEFRSALAAAFPHVDILLQDRLEAFAFHRASASPAEGHVARPSEKPDQANFFVAICSLSPIPEAHPFVYVPKTSNLLGDREKHIRLLETELDLVRRWLGETLADRDELLSKHTELGSQLEERSNWALQMKGTIAELQMYLEERTRWALELDANWRTAQERIVQLQNDFQAEQQHAADAIASLTEENLRKTDWALDTSRRLEETKATLAACTERAQTLDAELAASSRRLRQIAEQIDLMRHSRWLKLGRRFKVGPDLGQP